MRRHALAAAALALAACQQQSPQFKGVEAVVAREFAYPSGVEFRGIRSTPHGFCGEVNGRMTNGEMSGFRRFFLPTNGGAVIEGFDNLGDRDLAQSHDALLELGCPT